MMSGYVNRLVFLCAGCDKLCLIFTLGIYRDILTIGYPVPY